MIKTYSELLEIPTFEERFKYLQLNGQVGATTFGWERYLNQDFYRSKEWKSIRTRVIVRDEACDLAIPGHDIYQRILIHHMNPLTKWDVEHMSEMVTNPEYLICVSLATHNAIHYGNEDNLEKPMIERKPNDMCPWKRS